MIKDKQKIIDSFWDAVPDNTTWENLNKGMDISFTYNKKKVYNKYSFGKLLFNGYRRI